MYLSEASHFFRIRNIPIILITGYILSGCVNGPIPVSNTYLSPTREQISLAARVLRDTGYWNGEISSATPSGLHESLLQFQKDTGLKETGILDESTKNRLFRRTTGWPHPNKSEREEYQASGIEILPPPDQTYSPPTKEEKPSKLEVEKIDPNLGSPDFSLKAGEEVWVLEEHECKGSHESWQTYYRGVLQESSHDRVTVRLQERYGLWYDSRAEGQTNDGWWCIPSRRFCSEEISFNAGGGVFKVGDIANFPVANAIPYHLNISTLVIQSFEQECQKIHNTSADNRSDDFPLELREEIARFIEGYHFKSPVINDPSVCCRNPEEIGNYLGTLDPYSRYIPPPQREFSYVNRTVTQANLGLYLIEHHGNFIGVPVIGGAADHAGFHEPEWISSINRNVISFNDFASYSYLSRIIPGTVVPVETKNSKKENTYRVIAEEKERPSIEYIEHDKQSWIRIHRFKNRDEVILRKYLQRSEENNNRIVLDLRFCPGGSLYAAVDMISLFLPPDIQAVTLIKKNSNSLLNTIPEQIPLTVPISILVGPLTASSAEIFTRALSNNLVNVSVIGLPTTGKCTSQEEYPLSNGGALLISVALLKDSGGIACEGVPIQPELHVNSESVIDEKPYIEALSQLPQGLI